jgi:micrococcal nuclease
MYYNRITYWLIILTIFSVSCNSKKRNEQLLSIGSVVSGKVIAIIDGDTYDALIDGNIIIRIRMEGIDAPERGMPFYRFSKNYLSQLCFNEIVKININGKDGYDRFIAYSYLSDGRELSHEIIKAGLAWHFKKYNSDTTLSQLETQARNLKLGLWINENPMAPWTNRSLHRQGISTKDSFNTKESEK